MSTDFPERDRVADAALQASGPFDLTVIDAVIEERRAALDAAADGTRARMAYAVAYALNQRYQRTNDVDDIRAAVPYLQIAVAEGADDPFQARYVAELGAAFGTLADAEPDAEAVHRDEAVRLAEQATALTPVGHPQHAGRVMAHGTALCLRGRLRGSVSDFDQGIERLREAIDLAHPDDPRRGSHLMQLAVGLTLRSEHTGSVSDAEEAFEAIQYAGLAAHPYELHLQPLPQAWDAIRRLRTRRRRASGSSS